MKREGNAWYVILCCDDVPKTPLPPTGNQTGLDLGVTEFAALSDGTLIGNPAWWQQAKDELAKTQRAHSLRYPKHAPRSKRKTRSARAAAKVHARVARKRLDFHHKQAFGLVRDFDLIAYEHLNIAGMVRAPKSKPDPQRPGAFRPNRAAAKAGLNRRILDAAKAEKAGRLTIAVNAQYSSQTCSACAYIDPASRNGIMFRCTTCGYEDHADVNAARNHLRAGLALAQA